MDCVTPDDVLETFRFFKGAGLKSVPHDEDAGAWLRVLADVPAALLHLAAEYYLRTPVEQNGVLKGRKWCPSSAELRQIAFSLEADNRVAITQTQRGCASCGEVLSEEGSILEAGTGHRTIAQHCYPTEQGAVQWQAEPYRVAHRLVLCDCQLGKWIAHQHATADKEKMPGHWAPTLTLEQALQVFVREDAALYVSGSTDPALRYRAEDARLRSPFFCRAAPEELHGPTEYARALRAAAYDYLRGSRGAPSLDVLP